MSNEFEIEIEAGNYYRSRDGGVHGPIRQVGVNKFISPHTSYWRKTGQYGHYPCSPSVDLVERVHVFTDAELEAVKRDAVNDMLKPAGALGKFGLRDLTVSIDNLSVAFDTEAGGTIRLSKWPEGFILRYHGEVVWRSWVHDEAVMREKAAAAFKKIGVDIRIDAKDAVEKINRELTRFYGLTRAHLEPAGFALGDRVTKKAGAAWTGRVVGFYSTDLTPEGYAVESETEKGSVQISPKRALRRASKESAR